MWESILGYGRGGTRQPGIVNMISGLAWAVFGEGYRVLKIAKAAVFPNKTIEEAKRE
jgi:hypothetical protein